MYFYKEIQIRMAICVNSDKSAFSSPLFCKLVSCFPIRHHGKFMYCMFEDDMRALDCKSQVAAMLEELRDHFLKQGWDFPLEEDLKMLETVKILRQAVSVYGFLIGRNQTTLHGIPKMYFYITRDDEVVQRRPLNTLKVHHKRISLNF
jgi:hypothetical protein